MFLIDIIQFGRPVWHGLAILAFSITYETIIGFWNRYFRHKINPAAEAKLNNQIRLELYAKVETVDLECYDNPDYYTNFVWAMNEAWDRMKKNLDTCTTLVSCIVAFLLTGLLILFFDIFGLLFVAVSFVATFLINFVINKLKFNLDVAIRPLQRKRDYINRVFYLNDFSKEIRLYNVKEKLFADFDATNKEIIHVTNRHTKRIAILNFVRGYVFGDLIMNGLYVLYLLYQTIVRSVMGYGAMVALFQSVWRMRQSIQNFVGIVPEFRQHSMYIQRLREFLDYQVKITDASNAAGVPEALSAIEIKNLTFSYSVHKEPILKNINMTINPGDKIALVGYNGAGKTSFIKLLMRLYDPTYGEVLYGGKNIKEYKIECYRNLFSTIFQDYQLFAATIRDNVAMGTAVDEAAITDALDKSGFGARLAALPNGLDTFITKEFEQSGVNFSLGESQKIAISRVLYKNSNIIILDEPSSALDPIAEDNLNRTMLEHSGDKTVIFISHRLSTTKNCDMIYMFDEGCIVERGTHDELMARGGKYHEMFVMQAEKYVLYKV